MKSYCVACTVCAKVVGERDGTQTQTLVTLKPESLLSPLALLQTPRLDCRGPEWVISFSAFPFSIPLELQALSPCFLLSVLCREEEGPCSVFVVVVLYPKPRGPLPSQSSFTQSLTCGFSLIESSPIGL